MGIVNQPAPQRVTLRVGEQLTVQSSDPQSAGVVYVYGPQAGSESIGSGVVAANSVQTFGPYTQTTRLLIAPSAGVLSYAIAFVGSSAGTVSASTDPATSGSVTVTGKVPLFTGYTTQAGFKKNGATVAALGSVAVGAGGAVSYGPVALVAGDQVSFPWSIAADTPASTVPAAPVTPTPLSISGANGTTNVGDTASFTPTISGGTAPYTVSATGLPPGRTIQTASTGLTTGAYTTAGSFSATYTVTDAVGAKASFTRSVVVSASVSVPAAPSIALTAGAGQMSVAWTDGATNGAAITSHKLYRGTVSGTRTLVGTISTASPYVDSGLTNGTAYFYSLSAVNSAGEGPQSAEASATPVAAAATLASGAVGLWKISDYDAVSKTIPNSASGTAAYSGNILRAPRKLFANSTYYGGGNVTASADGATAFGPDGTNDASVLTVTAGWYWTQNGAFTSGQTYRLSVWGRIASGTMPFAFTTKNTGNRITSGTVNGVAGQALVLTTTWQRFWIDYTAGAGEGNVGLCADVSTGSPAASTAIQIIDLEAFVGAPALSTTVPSVLAGHLTLGLNGNDPTTNGKYAAGELDMSTAGASGLIQFPSSAVTAAFTSQAVVKKAATGSAYQAWLSKLENYTQFAVYLQLSGKPAYANGNSVSPAGGSATLWNRLAEGAYHVFTHRYDGAAYSFWIDDICVNRVVAGSALSGGLMNIWFNIVAGASLSTGDKYCGAVTLYNTALTDAQIQSNVTALQSIAAASGVTVNTLARFIVIEGDSRSSTANTTGEWPTKLAPNLTVPTLGVVCSVGGTNLGDANARITARPAIPTKAGRKIIAIMGMEGTNDNLQPPGYSGTTDAQAAAAYYTYMGQTLDLWRTKGATHVVLLTETPTQSATHNSRRNLLNTSYRSGVPGNAATTLVNLDQDVHWSDDNSFNDYPTYWFDNIHQSATVGDVSIETYVRPAVNAILAA